MIDRIRPYVFRLSSHLGVVVALGVLSVSLSGCYTQLQTTSPNRASDAPRAERSAQHQADPVYADEYRREYRQNATRAGDYYADGYNSRYEYKYQYKYRYGALSPSYSSRFDTFCDDAFFHDPWYYDNRCAPSYGSRFSLSFHFGSPFYYNRPWGHRYYSSFRPYGYSAWGYSPYTSFYGGTHYYGGAHYYTTNETEANRTERTRRPRSDAIGRGTTSDGRRINTDRAPQTRASATRETSGGRIGRSSTVTDSDRSAVERSTRDRSSRRPSTIGRRTQPNSEGRVGRTARPRVDRDREAQTRTSRDDRTVRQRPQRDRSRTSRGNARPREVRSRDRTRSRSRARTSSRDRSRSESSRSSRRSRSSDRGSSDDDDGGSR